jgi:hypothetical protein
MVGHEREEQMIGRKSGMRFLSTCLVAAAIGVASSAGAIDTGKQPAPNPPDVVNCGDRWTSQTCFECETGGRSACCRDPANCIVLDTVSSAVYHYSVPNKLGFPSGASYLTLRPR